jgi:formate hydrogenlyase transcriptional activator
VLRRSAALDDDAEILRRLVEGTARATGTEFFESLVRNLSAALDVAYAFVAELADQPTRVRTRALWGNGALLDNIAYDLAGTPCEQVISGDLCHHPRDLQGRFPADKGLVGWAAESFLGVPLFDASGQVMGHLAVVDTRPMEDEPRRVAIFQIFAARAGAELERLRAEQRLRESEQRFRDLYEEAPIAYVYEDTETRFVSANRAAIELLGLRPDEVVGTVGRSLLAPTDLTHQRVDDAFRDLKQGKAHGQIEFELRRKDDGKPVWVQFWSKPDPDGKFTRTMIIDITARVFAEQEKARLEQQNRYLQEEIQSEANFEEIIGGSAALRAVLGTARQVAPTDSTVLVLGETGTGKELMARAIHDLSRRRPKPLIKLNCSAIPTGLIESELFGHEKGAFTGALEKRVGRFALADGGTIFLDEIGDIPPEVQVRLLRVLQEQEFEPVGSSKTIKVDVRVIAATNRDLARAVADGSFRADLFYRLNVFPIAVPPLRERADDVPMLAHYFMTKYAARIGKSFTAIDADTMRRLVAYPWPGNVRELQNVIERAVILSPGPLLEVEANVLGATVAATGAAAPASSPATDVAPEPATLDDAQRQQIVRTLERCRWVVEGQQGAAHILGLHPNTLRSRMKKLGIKRAAS